MGGEVRILKGELELLIFGEKKFLHISLFTIFPKLVEIWHHLIQQSRNTRDTLFISTANCQGLLCSLQQPNEGKKTLPKALTFLLK